MKNYVENNYFNHEYDICINIYIAICKKNEYPFAAK